MNYTENAVTAKVHALYAKRLTDEDYSALLSFRSNEEIFNYLRSETYYSEYLNALPSVTLSRNRFENALWNSLMQRKASLCRFQKLIGDDSYGYFIKKDETEIILYCARHLDSDMMTELFVRPPVFANEQVISVSELQKATSFDEFAKALESTPYGKTVNALFLQNGGYKSLAALERILFNELYKSTEKIIEKKYKGKRKDEVLGYLKFTSDMNIISSLYRLLDNYPADKNYQTGVFAPSVTAFTQKELRKIENATSPEEISDIVKNSVYRKYFGGPTENIDLYVRRLIINESIKNIRYSQNPVLSLISYETVMKNEIQNIIHIIEWVKYGLSPEEISKIIVKGGV